MLATSSLFFFFLVKPSREGQISKGTAEAAARARLTFLFPIAESWRGTSAVGLSSRGSAAQCWGEHRPAGGRWWLLASIQACRKGVEFWGGHFVLTKRRDTVSGSGCLAGMCCPPSGEGMPGQGKNLLLYRAAFLCR